MVITGINPAISNHNISFRTGWHKIRDGKFNLIFSPIWKSTSKSIKFQLTTIKRFILSLFKAINWKIRICLSIWLMDLEVPHWCTSRSSIICSIMETLSSGRWEAWAYLKSWLNTRFPYKNQSISLFSLSTLC